MARVVFTPQLRRFIDCPPQDVPAATVGEALDRVFAALPHARGYVLDDQGRLRKHVTVFVDGEQLGRPDALAAPLSPEAEIYIMQALSGG